MPREDVVACHVRLESMTVRTQRHEVARVIVISVAVYVIHVELAWVKRDEPAMLTMRLLALKPELAPIVQPVGAVSVLAYMA